jgi:hypothetical protein
VSARIVILAVAVLLAGGAVLTVVGGAPWLLVAAACASMMLALRPLASWPTALASSFLILGAVCLAGLFFGVGGTLSLASKNVLLLGGGGAAALVYAFVRSKGQPLTVKGEQIAPLIVPVGYLIVAIVSFLWLEMTANPHLAFAMNGDAVWNTVSARFIVADGGVNPSLHPNPSPLTAGLLAGAIAPGRELVAGTGLLAHDITRQAQLWLGLVFATSILTAIIVFRRMATSKNATRVIVSALASALPWTWFYSGFAFTFGFYNATLALVVLLAVWILWLEGNKHPRWALAMLSLGSLNLLATWAPLAPLPLALMLVLFMGKSWKYWWSPGLWRAFVTLVTIALPVGYLAGVTLADVQREGGALSVDGGIFDFRPALIVAVMALAIMGNFVSFRSPQTKQELRGILSIVVVSTVAIGFLIFQRRDQADLWGYYPVKLSWILATFLIIVIVSQLASLLQKFAESRRRTGLYLGSAIAFMISLMAMVNPPSLPDIFTPVSLIFSKGVSHNDANVLLASQLASPTERNIAAQLMSTVESDLFINNWLLQLQATTSQDPVRWFSYYLDGTDTAMVCDATQAWGEGTTVVTSSTTFTEEFHVSCPGVEVAVIIP